jgi:hypothetical protein
MIFRMAMLMRSTGEQELIEPANGRSFSLQELQTLVGGYIEVVPTLDGQHLMVVDEEGKLKGKAPNVPATLMYLYCAHDRIVGDAVVLTREEMGEGEEDEDEDEE